MAPRRPPSDLCIIAVVKMLPTYDQLTAARMSPRSAGLVRAANRRVKTLIISTRRSNFQFRSSETISGIPAHSLAFFPSVQLLMLPAAAPGEPFSDYPNITTTARLTRWHYLLVEEDQLFDEVTIDLITVVFSAVTELKLFWHSDAFGKKLAALLERPQWARQLTSLGVFQRNGWFVYNKPLPPPPPGELLSRLAAAINQISSLQCLTMSAKTAFPLLPPDLCQLTQLKVLAISAHCGWGDDIRVEETSLLALERYVEVNNEEGEEEEDHPLQVQLYGRLPTGRLLALSPALRRRIVRFDLSELSWAKFDVPRLCRHFPSLNTLSLSVQAASRPIRALFAALSSLPQLVHLALEMTRGYTSWTAAEEGLLGNELGQQQQTPVQLRSLRALDLELSITSSNLPSWLNLPAAMPQLQALHLKQFCCVSRSTELCKFLRQKASSSSYSTDLEYFRSTLPLLHPGVPHERVILGYMKPYPTLEQLLSASW